MRKCPFWMAGSAIIREVNGRWPESRTLLAREFRLAVVPADPGSEEGFLKMEGEVEIWVEAETGTLLEIVGKVPRVPGKVRLVLAELG